MMTGEPFRMVMQELAVLYYRNHKDKACYVHFYMRNESAAGPEISVRCSVEN